MLSLEAAALALAAAFVALVAASLAFVVAVDAEAPALVALLAADEAAPVAVSAAVSASCASVFTLATICSTILGVSAASASPSILTFCTTLSADTAYVVNRSISVSSSRSDPTRLTITSPFSESTSCGTTQAPLLSISVAMTCDFDFQTALIRS